MTSEIKRTTNQYASEYGFFVGLIWAAMFFCYAEGISSSNMALVTACLIPALLSFIIPPYLSLRINKKLYDIGERLTYGRAYLFSLTMFIFASILSGATSYAYLTFIDKGQMSYKMMELLNDPNVSAAYRQMGMMDQYKEAMKAFEQLTPWDICLSLFSNGIMIGIIASVFLALIASYDLAKIKDNLR